MDYQLSTERQMLQRGTEKWPEFQSIRKQYFAQAKNLDGGSERITEKILEALFTIVLDWNLEDVNNQVENCDILLMTNRIKYLVIEAKRLGHFSSPVNIDKALRQAIGYAKNLKVKKVAVSDGQKLFLTEYCSQRNLTRGWIEVVLDREEYPEQLWHFSEHGIYRSLDDDFEELPIPSDSEILHPKYERPAKCFAYIGKLEDPKSWKLPFLQTDGTVDHKRLPKAIRSIISNYRGKKVSIPSHALPTVMEKLMKAAIDSGKMPNQNPRTPETFIQFAHILSQFGILSN